MVRDFGMDLDYVKLWASHELEQHCRLETMSIEARAKVIKSIGAKESDYIM